MWVWVKVVGIKKIPQNLKKKIQNNQLPISAFAICILMMMEKMHCMTGQKETLIRAKNITVYGTQTLFAHPSRVCGLHV